ncbi:MAG: hypothetical protein IPL11_16000 [Candidatus Accumulibacter sp.]|nr:hypothetical protein [Accumulibacter sp.]
MARTSSSTDVASQLRQQRLPRPGAHPRVREAMTAPPRAGAWAPRAHLLGGHRDEHAQLEQELAEWTGRSDALLFSSGYWPISG